MKVLVVEDDPNLRSLWGAVIAKAGHEAVTVETEADARARLADVPFDLVLLDLCLGDSDGVSIAGLAARLNPACRVVVVTGSALYTKGELFALAPSVWAVMRKPVDIEDIITLCDGLAGPGGPPPPAFGSGGAEFRT